MNLSRYNKFFIALAGALGQIILLFPNSQYSRISQVVLGVLTALGVYAIPNKPEEK